MRILFVPFIMFALACGDDDKPTAPTPTPDPAAKLIGAWRSTGNDFAAQLAANLKEYLIEGGLTVAQADMVISDMLGENNETFAITLNFRADGTVVVNDEQPDRFVVSGDRINVTTSDGETFSVRYAVTDTTLTLHYPVPPLLSAVGLEAEDEEEAELLRIMLKGIEVMTVYFSR